MAYFISRIAVESRDLGTCLNLTNPLGNEYKFSLDNQKGCEDRENLIPIEEFFLNGLTNEKIAVLTAICEEFSPITPSEEKMVKTVHQKLCHRLGWTPKVLTH